jgi:aminocarboxymuconate-semialdehyde decarboxylase
MRKHVFIDTQLVHPALIRTSVDLLGIDHVLAGSDWPIVDGPFGSKLGVGLAQAAKIHHHAGSIGP